MRPSPENALTNIASSSHTITQDHQALVVLRDGGFSQADVVAALNELRASVDDETLDDRFLELLDLATGFCPPALDVWSEAGAPAGNS